MMACAALNSLAARFGSVFLSGGSTIPARPGLCGAYPAASVTIPGATCAPVITNDPMGTKLYVGNLDFKTTEDALRAAFSANGRVVKGITIPSDRETGRPRGFAFVEMGSEADAQAAIKALHGKDLDGRQLKVNEAQDRPQRSGGGGGRGGFGGGRGGGGGGRERW